MYTAHVHFLRILDLFCIDNACVIYRKIRYLKHTFCSIVGDLPHYHHIYAVWFHFTNRNSVYLYSSKTGIDIYTSTRLLDFILLTGIQVCSLALLLRKALYHVLHYCKMESHRERRRKWVLLFVIYYLYQQMHTHTHTHIYIYIYI